MNSPTATQSKDIDCLSPEAQRLAEARLAAKRAARAEAREIRMKELERQQKEVEERPEKDFTEKGSRNMPSLSAATLASLGGTSSRRGSGDTSISIDTEASIREIKELNELRDQIQDVEGKYMQGLKEMKDSLAEVEEKYKKAMVSNAQLDNEKTNFMYQVDTLKDMLLELEEQLAESRRQYEEKNKEFEREKHAHSILQFQFAEVKEALKQREEMLEKHGIILNSEIATNGETSDTLNNVGYQETTKMTKELNTFKSTGDGTLGRATEVEVKNEIVENVGKKEILQNSEQEQHKEDTVQECVDIEVLHPGENTEEQKSHEDNAPSLGTLASAEYEERVESQTLEHTSFPASTEQVESREVVNVPDDGTGASLEQSSCLSDLDSEVPGPVSGQDSCNALDIQNQGKESVEKQEREIQEVSQKPCQESVPLQVSEVERVSSTDTVGRSENQTENVEEAGAANVRPPLGTVASSPPQYSSDTASHDENCVADAPKELDPSTGHSLEKEIANQEVAEPKEVPIQSAGAGRENREGEHEESGVRGEKPGPAEVQTFPGCPAAKSSRQEIADLRAVDSESEPIDRKDPDEEKCDQQGEALDSSQKKTKSKKKKNKKKKSPAAVGTVNDVKKELTYQDTDLSEVKEEQVKCTDRKPGDEAQREGTRNPDQEIVAESGENVNCPENPNVELDRKLNQDDDDVKTKAGKVITNGDTLSFEDDTIQSSGTSANDKELDEHLVKDDATKDGATRSSPLEPEDEVYSSSLLDHTSPSKDIADAPQTESTERPVTPEHPSQAVRKALDSVSLENDDLSAAGEVEESDSEGREEAGRGDGKGKGKEDCTMS